MENLLEKQFNEHIIVTNQVKKFLTKKIILVSNVIIDAFSDNKNIFLFGNGGSAADAQHIAAELTGRFIKERKGLAAIALTTDTSALTAIGNDYGFDKIFERQVEALAKTGDVLIGISTSGNSMNVINAIELGKKLKCRTISFTGKNGGTLSKLSDINLNIEYPSTARIQEMHIFIGHLICSIIDEHQIIKIEN